MAIPSGGATNGIQQLNGNGTNLTVNNFNLVGTNTYGPWRIYTNTAGNINVFNVTHNLGFVIATNGDFAAPGTVSGANADFTGGTVTAANVNATGGLLNGLSVTGNITNGNWLWFTNATSMILSNRGTPDSFTFGTNGDFSVPSGNLSVTGGGNITGAFTNGLWTFRTNSNGALGITNTLSNSGIRINTNGGIVPANVSASFFVSINTAGEISTTGQASSALSGVLTDETGSGTVPFSTGAVVTNYVIKGSTNSGTWSYASGGGSGKLWTSDSVGVGGWSNAPSGGSYNPSQFNTNAASQVTIKSGTTITNATLQGDTTFNAAGGDITFTDFAGLDSIAFFTGGGGVLASVVTSGTNGNVLTVSGGGFAFLPPTGGSGSQTPWASDIDGNNKALTKVKNITIGSDDPVIAEITETGDITTQGGISSDGAASFGSSVSATSLFLEQTTITTDFVAPPAYGMLYIDATDGPVTITLTNAASMLRANSTIYFSYKRKDGSANAVIITNCCGETIDGQSSYELHQYDAGTITTDGTNFFLENITKGFGFSEQPTEFEYGIVAATNFAPGFTFTNSPGFGVWKTNTVAGGYANSRLLLEYGFVLTPAVAARADVILTVIDAGVTFRYTNGYPATTLGTFNATMSKFINPVAGWRVYTNGTANIQFQLNGVSETIQ
jgi:hypothetical protein